MTCRGTRSLVCVATLAAMTLAACSAHAAHPTRSTSRPPGNTSPSSVAPTPLGCPAGAAYCDTFSDSSSGWGDTNQADFYYGYNSYLGGTYRIGSRAASAIDSSAPKSLHDISPLYGVRIDADVVMNPSAPAGTGFGVTCWAHPSADGAAESAFVFFVYVDHVKIVLWDAPHGRAVDVASTNISLLHASGSWNHLTATCVQAKTASGATSADLDLRVNGSEAVSAAYDNTAPNAQWAVAGTDGRSQAGVLASGAGADAFFDNVALTAQ
jgi:hypothetical protein